MAETRQRAREQRQARTRDRVGSLLVILLAAVAGLVAGHLASPQPWEHQTAATTQAGK
jgi:hypothetical protein